MRSWGREPVVWRLCCCGSLDRQEGVWRLQQRLVSIWVLLCGGCSSGSVLGCPCVDAAAAAQYLDALVWRLYRRLSIWVLLCGHDAAGKHAVYCMYACISVWRAASVHACIQAASVHACIRAASVHACIWAASVHVSGLLLLSLTNVDQLTPNLINWAVGGAEASIFSLQRSRLGDTLFEWPEAQPNLMAVFIFSYLLIGPTPPVSKLAPALSVQ